MKTFSKLVFVFLLSTGQGTFMCGSIWPGRVAKHLWKLNALFVGGLATKDVLLTRDEHQRRNKSLEDLSKKQKKSSSLDQIQMRSFAWLHKSKIMCKLGMNPASVKVLVEVGEDPEQQDVLGRSIGNAIVIWVPPVRGCSGLELEQVVAHELCHVIHKHTLQQDIAGCLSYGAALVGGSMAVKCLTRAWKPRSLWGMGFAVAGVAVGALGQSDMVYKLMRGVCYIKEREADGFAIKHANSAAGLTAAARVFAGHYGGALSSNYMNVKNFAEWNEAAQRAFMGFQHVFMTDDGHPMHYSRYKRFYAAARERLKQEREHPLPTTPWAEETLEWLDKQIADCREECLKQMQGMKLARQELEAWEMESLRMEESSDGESSRNGLPRDESRDESPRGGK